MTPCGKRNARRFVFSMLLLIPPGLASKFYTGPGFVWVQHHFGGVIYEIFWCLFFAWIRPGAPAVGIASCVLIVTCGLECLQLWHPDFLEAVRSTFIGRALIGTSFSWLDFPHYVLGCLMGLAWIRWARRESVFSLFQDR